MDLDGLGSRIHGTIVCTSDLEYEDIRRSLVWNELKPLRRPALIVQVSSDQDVIEAVRFAREKRLKVSVRGGGHSWVGFSLRDDCLLVDLGRLKSIRLDASGHAVVQPAATGRELNTKLAVRALAFPFGHCPTVPVSGFLLSGGLGWNTGGQRVNSLWRTKITTLICFGRSAVEDQAFWATQAPTSAIRSRL